ncbi:Bax inhibitor-1/YccA family protein [Chitinophagaceae bacterium LB-8]|uniref:Bax inhibitor-1/YccA family protein n=1 Tax=Paraflavisolibacter caeni TaxID=2982496 RepID=A0A9X2XP38_9BACT|nr:Bax inhibitor-1/YccA family protein [Paraflavisolibacter caeni]MCU7550363.1 Bax inhibitor-1/YccA family protein [Paraflavisolibacter caeni]
MGLFKGGNPVISEKTFEKVYRYEGDAMTVRGTVQKFGLLLIMVLGAASFTWGLFYKGVDVMPWMWGSMIGGFVLALIIIFKKEWAPYLALGYALLEGLFLGAISAYFDAALPGIVMQAVMLTFGTAGAMYFLYNLGIIKATNTFKKVVIAATAGIALFYAISLILRLFGIQMPLLHDNGMLGIGISLVIVIVAALNLILDFDMMEQGAAHGAPKYFEWYSAFGLLVTIVWLYMEILRLLSKLSSRN